MILISSEQMNNIFDGDIDRIINSNAAKNEQRYKECWKSDAALLYCLYINFVIIKFSFSFRSKFLIKKNAIVGFRWNRNSNIWT